ncbi:hypothetical protein CSUI_008141 [Cystoisospora suis]|uniref:Uncharacterized protein n=1 Tax=Cystoisospora suis TaxID=483139 RepID=A0A2C6KNI5_9APIC|nr:hypothetical protein CSUI_008141 [Cystoisospora suis]
MCNREVGLSLSYSMACGGTLDLHVQRTVLVSNSDPTVSNSYTSSKPFVVSACPRKAPVCPASLIGFLEGRRGAWFGSTARSSTRFPRILPGCPRRSTGKQVDF